MIKVLFKKNKSIGWEDTEFTYASYPHAEVGDIVVVQTRYGYGVAYVVDVDVHDERFNEDNLAKVKVVIESAAEQRKEQDRINAQKALAKKIRRMQMMHSLERLNFDNEDKHIIEDMTDDELEIFYNTLMK